MKKKNLIKLQDITFGTIAVSSLFLLLGANGAFAASSAVDEVTITVPASCSLTNTIGTAHTATIETGVYQDDIGETTFKVFCNDNEGFAVYAVGYTNDEFGNTTMKPSILADTNAIATGLATSGDTSNWAMKLTAVSGDYAPTLETGFNAYHVVPAEYTKVASYSSNTDSSSGSSFKSTYAAYVASAQPADTYTGKVKYTVVHPANELPQIESISELTYMQDFKNLSPTEKAIVLNSMEYNTTYNLIDNRDNRTYQVARLKDDNIWMAENLDLGRTSLAQDLTSQNTNVDTNTTIAASAFNGWIKPSGTETYSSAELISTSGLDSTSGTPYGTLYNTCAASAGSICSDMYSDTYNAVNDICPAGWRLPTGGSSGEIKALFDLDDYNTSAKIRAPIASGGAAFAFGGVFTNDNPQNMGKYGTYWSSTRSGGQNMYIMALYESSVYATTTSSRSTGYSVRCIAKKMPHDITVTYSTGISSIQIEGIMIPNGEVVELEEGFSYSIAVIPSAGYRFTSWSGEPGGTNLTYNQKIAYTVGDNDTSFVANSSFISTEMQNLSSNNCTSLASYVKDNRDGHVYVIKRLEDGKCWMMENLDLGRTDLTTDLTSSNTNLTDTVPASTFNNWKKGTGSGTYIAGEYVPITTSNASNGRDMDNSSKAPYGTLYNYCAASAGTICEEADTNNNNATSDICPAGWRLPTGGSSGDFRTVYGLTNYNTGAKMRASIASGGLAFARAGFFKDSTLKQQGGTVNLWSSTKYDGSNMYFLLIAGDDSVYPSRSSNRYYGYSMRCISDI